MDAVSSADAPASQSLTLWVHGSSRPVWWRLVAFVWFAAWWSRGQLMEAVRPGLTMLQDGLIEWIDTVRPAATAFLP